MMNDTMRGTMGAVGASASASKKDAMSTGPEVFDKRTSIEQTDNGSFLTRDDYHKAPTKGNRDPMPGYMEPKKNAFDTFDAMVAHLRTVYGAGDVEGAGAEPTVTSEPPEPAVPSRRPF